MNNGQPANPSHKLLVALVSVSALLSLGTMGLFIQEQGRSTRAEQELIATLAALRTNSPASPSVTNGLQPAVIPPVDAMRPITDPVPQVAPPSKDDWAVIVHEGVSISYPKNLTATTYEDEFTSGQRVLRISSSASRKVGVDSRNFQGYELVMKGMDDRQYSDNRKESTVNPQVSSIVEMCDGDTCPDAQYVFIKNGKRYLIEVLHQMKPYQAGIDLNNRIIASIK